MTIQVALAAMLASLALHVAVAFRFPPLMRTFILAQAAYWGLAYIGRPLYVAIFRPSGSNPVTDPRLQFTNYRDLGSILGIAVVGELAFIAALWVLSCRAKTIARVSTSQPQDQQPRDFAHRLYTTLYTLGWVGRVALLLHIPVLGTALSPLATAAAGLLIFDRRSEDGLKYRPATVLVYLGEAAWAALSASKTPLFTVIIALALRWSINSRPGDIVRRLPLLAVAALVSFVAIQPLKGIDTVQNVSERTGLSFGVATALVQRFDLYASTTDAYYFSPRPWLDASEYLSRTALNMLPKGPFLALDDSVGQKWAAEVKAATFPNQYKDVSLATSFAAEGYVEAGYVGSAIEGALLALLTVGALNLLQRPGPLLRVAGATYIFSAVLFEEGLLGQSASVAKTLEAIVASWLILEFYRPLRHKRGTFRAAKSQA